jgi:hypothetical protein
MAARVVACLSQTRVRAFVGVLEACAAGCRRVKKVVDGSYGDGMVAISD